MNITGLVVALAIGAVAGFLAGKIVKGRGFGIVGNIVVGVRLPRADKGSDVTLRERVPLHRIHRGLTPQKLPEQTSVVNR